MASKLDQEARVIALVAEGLTNKEIAHMLGVSDGAIRKRIATSFVRLGVTTRAAMVAKAITSGVIDVRLISH